MQWRNILNVNLLGVGEVLVGTGGFLEATRIHGPLHALLLCIGYLGLGVGGWTLLFVDGVVGLIALVTHRDTPPSAKAIRATVTAVVFGLYAANLFWIYQTGKAR